MKQMLSHKAWIWVLLVGWCLLFLRCETTEKSMIRAVCLAEGETGVQAALIYQAPEASADASEASAALQMVCAEGETTEQALFSAQALLPQTADFRLCDYVLVPKTAPDTLLADYEQLVLERQWGRTAARTAYVDMGEENLSDLCEKSEDTADKLLEKLKQTSARMPRLYQLREKMLLPQVMIAEDGVSFEEMSTLHTPEIQAELTAQESALYLLLKKSPGTRTVWLDGRAVRIRRCSVSVTLQKERALLRLDCQLAAGEPQPTAAQETQLEAQLCQLTEQLWAQGVDLLGLQQYSTLQYGTGDGALTIKNACPQLQADVRFLKF